MGWLFGGKPGESDDRLPQLRLRGRRRLRLLPQVRRRRWRAAATTPDERKVVTTLFCDLVGFTAMSEAADPEEVDAAAAPLRRRAPRSVIEAHGGTVEKFIGDAVVGVFGVPAVREDDARARRARRARASSRPWPA